MSDNNEPLDLQKIEARLTAVKTANYQFNITIVAADEDLANLQNLYINAPTDIAALVAEVKRLRGVLSEIPNILSNPSPSYIQDVLDLIDHIIE